MSTSPSATTQLTLICGHLRAGNELASAASRDTQPAARIIRDLCNDPARIPPAVQEAGADRLVLLLCTDRHDLGPIQAEARRAGLDALGLEIISPRDLAGPIERDALIVRAAQARALAFAGSRPEHSQVKLARELSRRSLLTLNLPEYRAVPAIDRELCRADLGCRACADVCPVNALSATDGRMHFDKRACVACGSCVAACPTGASSNPALTPAQLVAQVHMLTGVDSGEHTPTGIAYVCRSEPLPPLADGWLPVRLPCASIAGLGWMLAPLAAGATAVAAYPCGGSCKTARPEVVEATVALCRRLLELAGRNPETVSTVAGTLDLGGGAVALADGRNPFEPEAHGELVAAILAGPEPSATGSLTAPAGASAPAARAAGMTTVTPVQAVGTTGMAAANEPRTGPSATAGRPAAPARGLGVVEISPASCTGCGTCVLRCPTSALGADPASGAMSITFDARLCDGCGNCLPRCPEPGAISLRQEIDPEWLLAGRRVIYAAEADRCVSCGAPIAPAAMLARIREALGEEFSATSEMISRYCVACRGRPVAHDQS